MATNSASEAGFAAALEGNFAQIHDKLSIEPRFGVSRADQLNAEQFRAGVQKAISSIYQIHECRPEIQSDPVTTYGVWEERLVKGRNPLPVRTLIATPPNATKQPIVIINDGMGVRHTAGIDDPRYEGENVGQMLYEAGHPVLVVGLTGFEDTLYPSLWGISGINQYYVMLKAAGRDLAVVWVQDAFDATCMFFQKTGLSINDFGLVGVSKSGVISAILTHVFEGAKRAYMASSFSDFEQQYASPIAYQYATGERVHYDNAGLIAALWKEKVRLSFSNQDSSVYASEARDGAFTKLVNTARKKWGKRSIEQFGQAPFHYFDKADVTGFFERPKRDG